VHSFKVPVKAFDQISDFFRQLHQHLTDLLSDSELFQKLYYKRPKLSSPETTWGIFPDTGITKQNLFIISGISPVKVRGAH